MKIKDHVPLPSDNTANIIRSAMIAQRTVSFVYDGKHKTVEAHAVGESTADGALVLRGYQVGGAASRPLPIWALYRFDKIESLGIDTIPSLAPREGFSQGDRQMSKVLFELGV